MLDVSIRLEILNLLDNLKRDRHLALLYITHDLATARYFSDRIMVMYRGEIVESGRADDVILRPAHPYTQLLEASVPGQAARSADSSGPGTGHGATKRAVLTAERAETAAASGCRFRHRCARAMETCAKRPPDIDLGEGHLVRCWLYERAEVVRVAGRPTAPQGADKAQGTAGTSPGGVPTAD
ncbi:MAG TPA: oligopeptide/dipeptide ABC transporter ATP-binding protein, partial [Acidimicrobiales bacterium]|nr:oligopeptide/dipeptide ABC transporter ATP-binding protein [Acidimicrobiales bacterium]